MQALVDRVIEQIKNDIAASDLTAIDELLKFIPKENLTASDLTAIDALLTFVPKENLIAFLPEEERERFENDYCCDSCGGGFAKEEMDFDVNDQDLCKNCNHTSFNDAPYGEDSSPICGICGGDATICDGC